MSAAHFSKVRSGVRCVLWGVISYVAAVLIELVFGGHPTISATVRSLAIIGLILTVVGEVLCLNVPAEMPGSGLIYGAVSCTVAALLVNVSLFFWDPKLTFANVMAMWGMILLAQSIYLVGDILFSFFLRYLARYVRDKNNAKRAGALIALKFITLVMVVAAVALLFMGDAGRIASFVILFVVLIIWIIIVFQFMALLSGLSYSLAGASRPSFDPTTQPEEEISDNPFEDFE